MSQASEREDAGSQHTIEVLLDRIKALESKLNPTLVTEKLIDMNDVRVPWVMRPFPCTMYKASAKASIDVPGNITKQATSVAHLKELEAKGWQQSPVPYEWPDEEPVAPPVPSSPAARPGSALKPAKAKG